METDSYERLRKEDYTYLEGARLGLASVLDEAAKEWDSLDSIKADNLRLCANSIRSLKS